MTVNDMDQPPEMVTFVFGEGTEDEKVLDIPKNALKGLEPDRKQEVKAALARFIVGFAGNGELTVDDANTVLTLEGVALTAAGAEGPVTAQEFLGGIMFTGSSVDMADIRQQNGLPPE